MNESFMNRVSEDIGELKADSKNTLGLLRELKDSRDKLEERVGALEHLKYRLLGAASVISIIVVTAWEWFTSSHHPRG